MCLLGFFFRLFALLLVFFVGEGGEVGISSPVCGSCNINGHNLKSIKSSPYIHVVFQRFPASSSIPICDYLSLINVTHLYKK